MHHAAAPFPGAAFFVPSYESKKSEKFFLETVTLPRFFSVISAGSDGDADAPAGPNPGPPRPPVPRPRTDSAVASRTPPRRDPVRGVPLRLDSLRVSHPGHSMAVRTPACVRLRFERRAAGSKGGVQSRAERA